MELVHTIAVPTEVENFSNHGNRRWCKKCENELDTAGQKEAKDRLQQQQVQQPQVITIGSGPNQQMINVLPMQDQGQVYTVVSQGQQLPQQPLQPPISQHQPMPQQQYKQPSPVPHQTQNLQQQQNQPPPQVSFPEIYLSTNMHFF